MEGGELFDRVVDESFDLTERVAILFMRQIVDGLAYIHSQNILHLDMKVNTIIHYLTFTLYQLIAMSADILTKYF